MSVNRSILVVALWSTVALAGCRGGSEDANSDATTTTTASSPTVGAMPTPPSPKPPTLPTAGRACGVLEEPLRLFPGHSLSITTRGTRLREVRELQSMVNGAGDGSSCIPEDGDFGPVTRAAVMKFQLANDLTVDGIVGKQTWNQLNLILSH